MTRCPARARESARPTVVVDLPSPAGVGDIAETRTTLPWGAGATSRAGSIFALNRPYTSSASSLIPAAAAISAMGRMVDSRAISRSLLTFFSDIFVLQLADTIRPSRFAAACSFHQVVEWTTGI